jgi:hypothetical protein
VRGWWGKLSRSGRPQLAKFAARVTLAARGEALAASMSDYLITQLMATPTSTSGSAPELPTATAKPAWKP